MSKFDLDAMDKEREANLAVNMPPKGRFLEIGREAEVHLLLCNGVEEGYFCCVKQ